MRRKVIRPHSASGGAKGNWRDPSMSRRKRFAFRCGVPSLIALGLMFLIGGFLAILDPIPFASAGGLGRYGSQSVATTYSSRETSGWGVIFIGFGALFFIAAVRNQRS